MEVRHEPLQILVAVGLLTAGAAGLSIGPAAGTNLDVDVVIPQDEANHVPGQARTLEVRAPAGWEPGKTPPAGDPPLPEAEEGLGPGTKLWIRFQEGGSVYCSAGFVWEDASGSTYLSTAGHCLLPSDATATHGAFADYDASGVEVWALVDACPVDLTCRPLPSNDAWVKLGGVAYANQRWIGEDFGIVTIPTEATDFLRFEMPVWGGPVHEAGLEEGDAVVHYGYGAVHRYVYATRGRTGVGLGEHFFWPGFAYSGEVNGGDSGSAVVTARPDASTGLLVGDAAIGVVTHAYQPTGLVFGTTVHKARTMVAYDACLDVRPLPGGMLMDIVSKVCNSSDAAVHLAVPETLLLNVTAGDVHEVPLVSDEPFQLTRWGSGAVGSEILTIIHPEGDFAATVGECGSVPEDWTSVLHAAGGTPGDQAPVHPPGNYTLRVASPVDARIGIDFDGGGKSREVPTEISNLEAVFASVEDFDQSGLAPATLRFDDSISAPAPGVIATHFDTWPYTSAGWYEMSSSVRALPEESDCATSTDEGPGYSTSIGKASDMSVDVHTLIPGPGDLRWTGDFTITAASWDQPWPPGRAQAVLITLPSE